VNQPALSAVKQRADDFVYVDQIALAPLDRGRGIGRALYNSLEQWGADNRCRTVACEVNLAPVNDASLAFHARCGFNEVGRMSTADGRYVALLEHHIR
jgi:predicted GNAT superfamily acetyltransferase